MIVETEYSFKDALRAMRLSRGLTQAQLADAIGTKGNVVSNWEMPSGKSKPSIDMLRKICIVLNCPPGDLMGINASGMTGDEYALITGFRALDAAGQHTIMAVLESQLMRIGAADDPNIT